MLFLNLIYTLYLVLVTRLHYRYDRVVLEATVEGTTDVIRFC